MFELLTTELQFPPEITILFAWTLILFVASIGHAQLPAGKKFKSVLEVTVPIKVVVLVSDIAVVVVNVSISTVLGDGQFGDGLPFNVVGDVDVNVNGDPFKLPVIKSKNVICPWDVEFVLVSICVKFKSNVNETLLGNPGTVTE